MKKCLPDPMTTDRLWTVLDVAEYLAVANETVRKLVRRGELPYVRVGKQLRFVRTDIDAWINTQVAKEKKKRASGT